MKLFVCLLGLVGLTMAPAAALAGNCQPVSAHRNVVLVAAPAYGAGHCQAVSTGYRVGDVIDPADDEYVDEGCPLLGAFRSYFPGYFAGYTSNVVQIRGVHSGHRQVVFVQHGHNRQVFVDNHGRQFVRNDFRGGFRRANGAGNSQRGILNLNAGGGGNNQRGLLNLNVGGGRGGGNNQRGLVNLSLGGR